MQTLQEEVKVINGVLTTPSSLTLDSGRDNLYSYVVGIFNSTCEFVTIGSNQEFSHVVIAHDESYVISSFVIIVDMQNMQDVKIMNMVLNSTCIDIGHLKGIYMVLSWALSTLHIILFLLDWSGDQLVLSLIAMNHAYWHFKFHIKVQMQKLQDFKVMIEVMDSTCFAIGHLQG